jgi:VanZ family protein
MIRPIFKLLAYLPNHRFVLSSIWTLVILYLSLGKISAPDSISLIPYSDKIVHFSMYLILSSLLLFEFQNSTKKNIIVLIMLYSISFGISMELLQNYFFSYRTGDYFDALANTLGTFSALSFFLYFKKSIKK